MAIPKRPAASAAAGVAKKQRSVPKQCTLVETALLGAEAFPEKVRRMVSSNLKNCLGVPKEDRHPYHEKVIGMVGEILASIQTSVETSIQAAESKLSSASDEKESREQAHKAAASALTTKIEAMEVAKAALATSTQATKAAKAALSQAQVAQAEGDVELEEASGKKAKLETVVRDTYTPLKEGSIAAGALKGCISALVTLGKQFDFDPSMVTSLPSALVKAPSERGSFDAMVWKQLEDELNNRIKTLDDTLASGAPAKAERAGNVETAKRELESAQANAESCKNNLEQSKAEVEDAKTDHSGAAKAVSQFAPEMKQVEKDLAAAKADLAEFTEGASAAYKELLEFTAIPPAPIATEEQGAPAAEL